MQSFSIDHYFTRIFFVGPGPEKTHQLEPPFYTWENIDAEVALNECLILVQGINNSVSEDGTPHSLFKIVLNKGIMDLVEYLGDQLVYFLINDFLLVIAQYPLHLVIAGQDYPIEFREVEMVKIPIF